MNQQLLAEARAAETSRDWLAEAGSMAMGGVGLERRVRSMLAGVPGSVTRRRIALLAIAGAIATGLISMGELVRAQVPNSFSGLQTVAVKQFEVATVKLNPSGESRWRLGPPSRGSVSIDNLDLKKIIASSFRVQDSMVEGPDWLAKKRYDIVGKGPDPALTNPEVWEMMRSLLAERFALKYHIEQRERPVYALTVARGGHKLLDGEKGRCAEAIKENKICGDIYFPRFGSGIVNMQIGAFIGGLARVLQDRPIIDHTGLTGKYDGFVYWLPDNVNVADIPEAERANLPEDTSLFTAIERQLGLKLEARREPVGVVVIDSIREPEAN